MPFALLAAATEGRVDLISSPTLIAELAEVLARPHLAGRLQQIRGSVEEACALYAALTVSVMPAAVQRAVPNDPDDDHVIAAAIVPRRGGWFFCRGRWGLVLAGSRTWLVSGAFYTDRRNP